MATYVTHLLSHFNSVGKIRNFFYISCGNTRYFTFTFLNILFPSHKSYLKGSSARNRSHDFYFY